MNTVQIKVYMQTIWSRLAHDLDQQLFSQKPKSLPQSCLYCNYFPHVELNCVWENVSCSKVIALLFLLVTKTTISDGLFVCASIESRFALFRRTLSKTLGSPFYHMRTALLLIFWTPDIFHKIPIYSYSADTTNTIRKIKSFFGGWFLM